MSYRTGVEYKVIWSVLVLVDILTSYLETALAYSPITNEAISKAVNVINIFDAKARQLVLGAQAIHVLPAHVRVDADGRLIDDEWRILRPPASVRCSSSLRDRIGEKLRNNSNYKRYRSHNL